MQTREPRQTASYRVADATPKAAPSGPAKPRPVAPPILPPESNAPAAGQRQGGGGKYPGTVMGQALERSQTGRLGDQPAARPAGQATPQQARPQPGQTKPGAAVKSAAAMPAPAAPAMPRPRPAEARPPEARPLPERRPPEAGYAPRQRRPLVEWYEAYYVPVAGPNHTMLICVALSAVLLWALFTTPLGAPVGTYSGPSTWSDWMSQTFGPAQTTVAAPQPRAEARPAPPGENSVLGPPTVTADQIDAILAAYGSPAAGSGKDFYNLGVQYGIDPAYAVAFFIHESGAGTAPGWAGLKPDGSTTHNIGNIICAGYGTCFNRFRDYGSWAEGIDDWYKLISTEYVGSRGAYTVEEIIPVYAPSFENNVPAYIQAVNALVGEWRAGGRR